MKRILEVPLFFKLTVANAVVVVGSVVVTLALAVSMLGGAISTLGGAGSALPLVVELVGFAGALALLAAVGVNVVLTRLALSPLQRLEDAARRVEDGDLGVRVAPSPLADRDLQQLVEVFNRMLDSVEAIADRRREMAASILEAEERTRSQVSRELYEDLAQHLATLLLALPGPKRGHARSALRDEVAAAVDKVREVARRLRPPELDELGLVPALEAEGRILGERTGREIRIDRPERDPDLPPEARLALFRILQEALVNAVRHADAGEVRLRLRERGGQVVADVEDDGKGFDAAAVLADDRAGPGLRGMMERACYVGGTVEIESRPGRGTRVRAAIPAEEGRRGGRIEEIGSG